MKLTKVEERFIQIEIDSTTEGFCEKEARKMQSHLKELFPNDPTIQSIDKYKLWNIGKIALWYWLRTIEKNKLIRIERIPFKDDYRIHDDMDDMVVTIFQDGSKMHLEARTRSLDMPITPEQYIHIDCIKPCVTYVFVLYNPTQYTATIVGYADWLLLRSVVMESECPQSGNKEEGLDSSGEFKLVVGVMNNISNLFKKNDSKLA